MSNEYLIPIFKPSLPKFEQVRLYIERIDETQVYTNRGPLVKELEERYANYFNVASENVVAMCNATLALEGAVTVSAPKKWIVPDFTFPATAHSVINSGKLLYLSDIDDVWQLKIEIQNLDKNAFGLVPVMPFGAKIEVNKYAEWESVVIDAAASLGNGPIDLSNLPKNWFIIFSLHATKVLGAGEGALVVCGAPEGAEALKKWSNFGFDLSRISRSHGTNAKMPEIIAAYALASLDSYALEKQDWLSVQTQINLAMSGSFFENITNSYSGFNPYWIIDAKNENFCLQVQNNLSKAGIETRKWWPQLMSDIFEPHSNLLIETHNSRRISSSILGLPKFRTMKKSDIDKVVSILFEFKNLDYFSNNVQRF